MRAYALDMATLKAQLNAAKAATARAEADKVAETAAKLRAMEESAVQAKKAVDAREEAARAKKAEVDGRVTHAKEMLGLTQEAETASRERLDKDRAEVASLEAAVMRAQRDKDDAGEKYSKSWYRVGAAVAIGAGGLGGAALLAAAGVAVPVMLPLVAGVGAKTVAVAGVILVVVGGVRVPQSQ